MEIVSSSVELALSYHNIGDKKSFKADKKSFARGGFRCIID